MMFSRYIFIIFFICTLCAFNFNAKYALSAESPNNVGDFFRSLEGSSGENTNENASTLDAGGAVQSLPGVEVSPEDMQKAFPNSLKQDAPRMDFIPDAAPLFPVLNMQNNKQKSNVAPSIKQPQTLPSLQLTTPKQENNANKNMIKIVPEDLQKKNNEKSQNSVNKQDMLDNPSLEYMIGQMIMAGFTGGELEKDSAILALVRAGKVGGVFLVPSPKQGQVANNQSAEQENIYNPSQLRALTASLQSAVQDDALPLFIAVEQEGGMVQSLRPDLGFAGLSAAAKLGQGSVEQTEIAARGAGLEMAGLGINFALGPAGDVNLNPLSEDIGKRFRSFGPNPQNVAAHALAFGRGLVAAKVVPCLRNFPGMGSRMSGFAAMPNDQNSQNLLYSIPDLAASWQNVELVPYSTAIKGGWIGAMQPALAYHRAVDALHPAPLSRTLISGILRGRLGFDGLVLSQDLRLLQPMFSLEEAVVQAVLAGADIILTTEPPHLKVAQQDLGALQGLENLPIDSMIGGNALTKQLLKQGLGQAMPGMGLGGSLQQKIQTGHAGEAAKVYEILLGAVRSGRISEQAIRASWSRIKKAKQEFLLHK